MGYGELIGKQLGNYRILRCLGKGGFSEVYLGEQIYLKTPAALKVLSARFSETSQARFLTEAQVVARLDHPHIVRVLDFGVEEREQLPYLVMSYAAHGTIRLRYPLGQRVSLPAVGACVRQIAAALQYAHDQGVIHRDVKPENILVGTKGEALLSDFGLAIVVQNEEKILPRLRAGTLLYMAPEQLLGKPGRASDQYALGVIAYEWLCGQPPFLGNRAEIASQHIQVPPTPLHQYIPDIPAEIENAILRALAKDPGARFPRVEDFARELEQAYRAFYSQSFSEIKLVEQEVPLPGILALFSDGATQPAWPLPITSPIASGKRENNVSEGSAQPVDVSWSASDTSSSATSARSLSPSTSHHAAPASPDTSSLPVLTQTPPPPVLPQTLSLPVSFHEKLDSSRPSPDGNVLSREQGAEAAEMPQQEQSPRRSGQHSRRSIVAAGVGLAVLGGGTGWYMYESRAKSSSTAGTKLGPGKSTKPATANSTRTATQQATQAPSQSTQATQPPDGQPTPTAAQANATATAQSTALGAAQPTTSVPTPTPTATTAVVLTVTIAAPARVIYGNTYTVTVTTSEPGCSVVLTADYDTSGTHQNIGTQSTNSQGSTGFSWQVKTGLLSSSVTLTATATNAAGIQATTKAALQVGLL